MRRIGHACAAWVFGVVFPASTFSIFPESIMTDRLVGAWNRGGPGEHSAGRLLVTLKILDGPAVVRSYSGGLRCRDGLPGDCPGRRGELRDITLVPRTQVGRDVNLYDFDADVAFKDGTVCRIVGTAITNAVLALTGSFTCATSGMPEAFGNLWVVRRKPPR